MAPNDELERPTAAVYLATRAHNVSRARDALLRMVTVRSKRWLDDLPINIFSVPDLKDRDLATGVVDEIDNTVLALTYSIPVVIPSEFLGLLCARVDGQAGDLLHDSATVFLRADGLEFLSGRGF